MFKSSHMDSQEPNPVVLFNLTVDSLVKIHHAIVSFTNGQLQHFSGCVEIDLNLLNNGPKVQEE